MKIKVKRSWLPWGKPSIKIDMSESTDIEILGATSKRTLVRWQAIKSQMQKWEKMERNAIYFLNN